MGVTTVRQAELTDGVPSMTEVNNDAIRRTIEAGIEFLDENGGGTGVRLRKSKQKAKAPSNYNCEQDIVGDEWQNKTPVHAAFMSKSNSAMKLTPKPI